LIIEELFLKASFLVNPIINPTLTSKTILKNEIIKRAINDGIYYITTEENADKIIEESNIISIEPFISYGLKKPIFYGGIPNLPVSIFDFKLPQVLTAIKIKVPYETLALFQIEMKQRAYKLYYPNFLLEEGDLKKVYLGLTIEDYKICYKEILEEKKDDYQVQVSKKQIKNIEKNLAKELKSILQILKQEKRRLLKSGIENII